MESVSVFLGAFGLVFIAEVADKTMLITLAFATRYKVRHVIIGVVLASILVSLVGVGIGQLFRFTLPRDMLLFLSGVVFVVLGIWTLFHKEAEHESMQDSYWWSRFGAVGIVFGGFFLAELADKTQVATLVFSSQVQDFFAAWVGASLGLVGANAAVIGIVKVLGKNIPQKVLTYATVVIFIGAGVYSIVQGFGWIG